jgi:uncharacterized protein YraI
MQLRNVTGRSARTLAVLVAMLVGLAAAPIGGAAQTCTDCELYAVEELNLRQEPSLEAAVLRFIPAGAAVQRSAEPEVNGYAPVVYDGVPGWAVSLGLVATPEEVAAVGSVAEPVEITTDAVADADLRYTLSPLLLRSGPSSEAEPVLTMPEGAYVTLTREGAENGYVTINYDGTLGWAYADLLGGDQ